MQKEGSWVSAEIKLGGLLSVAIVIRTLLRKGGCFAEYFLPMSLGSDFWRAH